MAKNFTVFSLRFSFGNEQHVRLYKILDDLNLKIHHSKNQFIMDAIEFYLNSFDDEQITNKAYDEKQKRMDERYMTREEFQIEMAKMEKEITVSVYQNLVQSMGMMQSNVTVVRQELQENVAEKKVEEPRYSYVDEVVDKAMEWS